MPAAIIALLLLAGCSAVCTCEASHMKSARLSLWMARMNGTLEDFLAACPEACRH